MRTLVCHKMRRLWPSLITPSYRFTLHPQPQHSRLASNAPMLTTEKYPSVKRGDYAQLIDSDLAYFERHLLDPGQVLTDETDTAAYNVDWMNSYRGSSKIVLRPKTTEQVSCILQHCNTRQLAVVPQGGNTGLVGGSVPVFDEVIVSTRLLNKIISIDPVAGILECEAGCVLETLDDNLAEHNLMMPLDLGAKGSCLIGGNISTNAGGMRLLRYGSLHGSVLGIEGVLASGEVVDGMCTLRKDNTGFDIKQLFIGSEGHLGIVTKQPSIALSDQTQCLKNFENVLSTLQCARMMLEETLSGFEFMDSVCMDSVEGNLGLKCPIQHSPFYVLIETSGSNDAHNEEKLSNFLEKVTEDGYVCDGTMANNPSKIKNLWQLRERVNESIFYDGHVFKYDVSIPVSNLYHLVTDVRSRLGGHATRVMGCGHVGDGNLHLNVTVPEYNKETESLLEPYVFEWLRDCKGSISAEHGVGFHKRNYLHYSRSRAAVDMMKRLKHLLDPRRILNPYKTLPDN